MKRIININNELLIKQFLNSRNKIWMKIWVLSKNLPIHSRKWASWKARKSNVSLFSSKDNIWKSNKLI
jgi:hypothetical protein